MIELVAIEGGAAGEFELVGTEEPTPATPGLACADDVALLLHTSGTTARPKRVPLTHKNVTASAAHIRATLGLSADDRCLNVMPLFHIHGLVGSVLASVTSAAGLVCTPGFDASRFFEWLSDFQVTWYTAVPSIHQAILAEAACRSTPIGGHRLRLIRSSSSPLPPVVMGELERIFAVPVLESYGMTEASHQVCSNPRPTERRKAGSVGPAAGPEVAVFDDAGRALGPGETGEIVIRGPNVITSYEDNPETNARAFTAGWFRTGDQGYHDTEGYLYLTGRLKELINRGGEKVAPREIDEALLEHPHVAQAIAFAVPHPTLGEDVVAAVVLHAGKSVSEEELRRFASDRLAVQKVPSQVLIVHEIPKGPSGKPRRINLHLELADRLRPEFVAPDGPFEEAVARAWREVLAIDSVGARDNFFTLGGDSLRAARVIGRLNSVFDVELPRDLVFRTPVLTGQALIVEDIVLSVSRPSLSLTPALPFGL